MEARKILATIASAWQLARSRFSLLGLGLLTVLLVVIDKFAMAAAQGIDPDHFGFVAGLYNLAQYFCGLVLLVWLARMLASDDMPPGAILWGPLVAAGAASLVLSLMVPYGLGTAMAKIAGGGDQSMRSLVQLLSGAASSFALLIPLTHFALAARGNAIMGLADLPARFGNWRFAWLGGSMVLGAILLAAQLGFDHLTAPLAGVNMRLTIMFGSFRNAAGLVGLIVYALAAADFLTRRIPPEEEVFS